MPTASLKASARLALFCCRICSAETIEMDWGISLNGVSVRVATKPSAVVVMTTSDESVSLNSRGARFVLAGLLADTCESFGDRSPYDLDRVRAVANIGQPGTIEQAMQCCVERVLPFQGRRAESIRDLRGVNQLDVTLADQLFQRAVQRLAVEIQIAGFMRIVRGVLRLRIRTGVRPESKEKGGNRKTPRGH